MTLIVNINSQIDGVPSSDLKAVGEALKALSDLHKSNPIQSDQTIPFIDHRYDGPGKEHLQAVALNTSVSTVQKNAADVWELLDAQIGRDLGALSASGINIKFVFEQNHEMIFVVRDADALDYGLHNGPVANLTPVPAPPLPPSTSHPTFEQSPPMNEGEYLLMTDEIAAFSRKLLDDIVEQLEAEGQTDAAALTRTAGTTVLDNTLPNLDPATREDIFHQQLGAYSVRQCS